MASTATSIDSYGKPAAVVSGAVHGGNQPVYNATVSLYTVGQSGVGSSGTLLATTTTNGAGGFQFVQVATPSSSSTINPTALGGNSYECGNTNPPLLYIVARGGNTTGNGSSSVNNSASVFMAPVGSCTTASSVQVDITEVTTAAMIVSVGQFINPSTEMIGADGTGIAFNEMANAFNTVSNLVSQSTGQAVTMKDVIGGATSTGTQTYNVSTVGLQINPEYQKLNTVADILSACINQTSSTSASNCTTLFTNAVPPANAAFTSQPSATFAAATDTLQAALYMFINPSDTSTANRTALYNLVTASAPFQPTLTALPTDWTIGIMYETSTPCDAPDGSSQFFNKPRGLAVDESGNIWVSNQQSSSSALVELSPTGTPMACQTMGTTLASSGSSSVAVDDAGGIWYGDTGLTNLIRFSPTTGATLNFPVTNPVLAIATDGSDNVFFTGVSGSTGYVYKIRAGATATASAGNSTISQVVGTSPTSLFPDTVGDIWVASGSNFVTELAQDTGGGSNYLSGYSSNAFSITAPVTAVTVGATNYVYVTSAGSANSLAILKPSGATYMASITSAANTGGEYTPNSIALDGSANSWIANGSPNSSDLLYGLTQISSTGTAISTSGTINGGYQKPSNYFQSLRTAVIDYNGNVWSTSDAVSTGIVETVGAAVPVYGDYAFGLTNGRFQTIP